MPWSYNQNNLYFFLFFLFCLFFSKQNTDNINAMNYHLVNAVSHDQSPKIYITQTDKKGCWCRSLLWISRSYWGHWKIWQATIIRKDRKLCAPGFRCLVASNKQSTSLTFAFNHATTCFRKALQDSGCLCRFWRRSSPRSPAVKCSVNARKNGWVYS